MKLISLSILFFLTSTTSFGAIDRRFERRSAPVKKMNQYIKDGQFFGGKSGSGYSLTDVRRIFSAKDQVERIILEVGDEQGRPSPNAAYFQVNLYKELNRIDVDLAQMQGASLDQKKITDLFKQSAYVKNVKLNYDPEDRSIIMQIHLKQPGQLEVIRMPGQKKHARIVLDIQPIAEATSPRKVRQ